MCQAHWKKPSIPATWSRMQFIIFHQNIRTTHSSRLSLLTVKHPSIVTQIFRGKIRTVKLWIKMAIVESQTRKTMLEFWRQNHLIAPTDFKAGVPLEKFRGTTLNSQVKGGTCWVQTMKFEVAQMLSKTETQSTQLFKSWFCYKAWNVNFLENLLVIFLLFHMFISIKCWIGC